MEGQPFLFRISPQILILIGEVALCGQSYASRIPGNVAEELDSSPTPPSNAAPLPPLTEEEFETYVRRLARHHAEDPTNAVMVGIEERAIQMILQDPVARRVFMGEGGL